MCPNHTKRRMLPPSVNNSTKRYIQTLFLSHSLLLSNSFQAHILSKSFISTSRAVLNNSFSPLSNEDIGINTVVMPRGVKKENLPTKICVVCNRPFTWRKKWEKVWDEVTTCSKSCNRKRKQEKSAQNYMSKCNTKKEKVCSEKCNHGDEDFEIVECCLKDEGTKSLGDTNDDTSKTSQHFISGSADNYDSVSVDLLNELQIDDESFESDDVNSNASGIEDTTIDDPVARRKAQRKAEKKRKKQERRAQREGRGDPTAGQKQCDMCEKHVDLLIRCTYDESLEWKMVCGRCWKIASGGVVDGDGAHPYYKYGGLWKNRRRK